MIQGLESAGAQVIECHVPLWAGTEDNVAVASGRYWIAFMKRLFKCYFELVSMYRHHHGKHDAMMLGYTGAV